MSNNADGFRCEPLKGSLFSRKPQSKPKGKLNEDQCGIDSCCLFRQSIYLNIYNKDCDWLISACFIRAEQMHADAFSTRVENQFLSENSA